MLRSIVKSLIFNQSVLPHTPVGPSAISALQTRNIYYDRNTSQPHTHPEALKRYFRLRWGGWIRARPGFKRHLWRKPFWLRWWASQHIFVKKEECEILERMIAPKYKKSRYFVDDIYEPYHKRTNFDTCPPGRSRVSSSWVKTAQENL
ncbi:39S ribosomal protein L35, mitochondrial [Tetranychus urticae]|uniref:Large ribosomal subunit protein bL35m n=1 Tax=Tetranychus urticae TaxID=32264 RepID=T1KNQ4_TETUR|nr:39S ribosomal protein L35, mitochondrial [Tetranychus urticae]